MSKGPRIKPTVKRIIVSEALEDRNKNKPRRLLMLELQTIIDRMGEIVPAEETLEKLISWARNHPKSPLDEPFSLASLAEAEYDIPPEAMPTVMSFYKKRLAEDDVLTIREALWTARLHKIIDPPDLVWDWAFLYALEEMVSEVLRKPFDSRRLDMEMITNVYSARETQREIAIWEIAEKYGADPVKLKDLNLSIEETEETAKSGKYRKEAQQ